MTRRNASSVRNSSPPRPPTSDVAKFLIARTNRPQVALSISALCSALAIALGSHPTEGRLWGFGTLMARPETTAVRQDPAPFPRPPRSYAVTDDHIEIMTVERFVAALAGGV